MVCARSAKLTQNSHKVDHTDFPNPYGMAWTKPAVGAQGRACRSAGMQARAGGDGGGRVGSRPG